MRWLQRRSKQRKLATPSRTDGELSCPSAMLQIVLSLLLTFTGAVVRPLAWMLCTPPLAWPCRTCPRAAVHATPAIRSSGEPAPASLPACICCPEACLPQGSRHCQRLPGSHLQMELCGPGMTKVATLLGRLHRGGMKDLPLAQPQRVAASYAASSLDCQLELCILSQEAPHKKGWGGKEVAMFTDLFLLSCSLKEFSNT